MENFTLKYLIRKETKHNIISVLTEKLRANGRQLFSPAKHAKEFIFCSLEIVLKSTTLTKIKIIKEINVIH